MERWPPRALPNVSDGVGASCLISNYVTKNVLMQWIIDTLKGHAADKRASLWHINGPSMSQARLAASNWLDFGPPSITRLQEYLSRAQP
jgi:hypothetical protein